MPGSEEPGSPGFAPMRRFVERARTLARVYPLGRSRARRPGRLLIGSLAVVAIVCGVAVWRAWADARGAGRSGRAARRPPRCRSRRSRCPTIRRFSSSATRGRTGRRRPSRRSATPTSSARAEGWNTVVNGVRGSGYLKPGIDGGSYGERIAQLDPALDPDLVIVEGSINDRRLYPDGIPGCCDRRVGRARGALPRGILRHHGSGAAGAAGGEGDGAHRRRPRRARRRHAAGGTSPPSATTGSPPPTTPRSSTRPRSAATTPRPAATPTWRSASPRRSTR